MRFFNSGGYRYDRKTEKSSDQDLRIRHIDRFVLRDINFQSLSSIWTVSDPVSDYLI